MSDQLEASIEEAYARGVEAGRLDAVPPGTEPMKWCEIHDSRWDNGGCLNGWVNQDPTRCRLEDPVGHWVTVKEGTT